MWPKSSYSLHYASLLGQCHKTLSLLCCRFPRHSLINLTQWLLCGRFINWDVFRVIFKPLPVPWRFFYSLRGLRCALASTNHWTSISKTSSHKIKPSLIIDVLSNCGLMPQDYQSPFISSRLGSDVWSITLDHMSSEISSVEGMVHVDRCSLWRVNFKMFGGVLLIKQL